MTKIAMTSRGQTIRESELSETFIRASGPGGQNVNKVATAVQLAFNATEAAGLNAETRRRLIKIAGSRASRAGIILIEASRFRTQERNRRDARARLAGMLDKATEPPPPPRKKTRPSRGAIERRLQAKAGRSRIKQMRGKVRDE